MTRKYARPYKKSYKSNSGPQSTMNTKVGPKKQKRVKLGKFAKKVTAVLNKSLNYGMYRFVTNGIIQQSAKDVWGQKESDQAGQYLDLFTPARFKDVEGILFNGKAPSISSFNTTTVANPVIAGTNFATAEKFHVVDSTATLILKNVSGHCSRVEVFISSPKCDNTAITTPFGDWAGSYGASTSNVGSDDVATHLHTSICADPYTAENFNRYWYWKKLTYCLMPGQDQKIFIQGPQNRTFDGSKILDHATSTLLNPTWKRFSPKLGVKFVSFRILNDISLDNDGFCHHFPHNTAYAGGPPVIPVGGVAFEIQRYYHMRAPTQTSNALSNTVGGTLAVHAAGSNTQDQERNMYEPNDYGNNQP